LPLIKAIGHIDAIDAIGQLQFHFICIINCKIKSDYLLWQQHKYFLHKKGVKFDCVYNVLAIAGD